MATTYNISAIQGSTLLLNITCRDSAGNFIDFTNYNVRGFVKDKFSSTGVLLNLNPQIHPSFISGLITISGKADDIARVNVGIYPYDIEASGLNNYVFKPLKGYFYCEPQSTN